jgi:hypothetical protein
MYRGKHTEANVPGRHKKKLSGMKKIGEPFLLLVLSA